MYVTSVGESRSSANQFRLPLKSLSLPESGEAAGWQRTGAARVFDASNLWEYMDGGADRYVKAGLLRTLTAPYRYAGRVDAVAELHQFRSAVGAATLFEAVGQVGDLSYCFLKGACLGRVVAYDAGSGDALRELGRAMEKRC